MGKDLHYSILPFIQKALSNHQKVESIQLINDSDFYIFKIKRRYGMSELYVVLSDNYYFGDYDVITRHPILNNGGFILIARPEASSGNDSNDIANKIGIGKIGKLLGALNIEEYWNYTPPKKDGEM